MMRPTDGCHEDLCKGPYSSITPVREIFVVTCRSDNKEDISDDIQDRKKHRGKARPIPILAAAVFFALF